MESIIIKIIDLIITFASKSMKKDFEIVKYLKKMGLLKLEANFDSRLIHSLIEFGKNKTNLRFIEVMKDKVLQELFQKGIYENKLDEFKKKAEFTLHKKLAFENITLDIPYEQIIDDFVSTFETIDKQTESKAILDFINNTNLKLFELSETNYKNSFEYKIEKYLAQLIDDFYNKFVNDDLYVDLNGVTKIKTKVHLHTKGIVKEEMNDNSYVELKAVAEIDYEPIDKYINEWLEKENKNFLIILGEYGTGKSTLCEYISCDLAKGNLNQGEQKIQDKKHRKPIIFNLRNFRNQGLEAFLISELSINVNEVSFIEFKEKLKNDEFILIFDGFDEMAAEIDVRGKKINFDYIFDILKFYKNSKIILTSRIEYFQSLQEQSEALKVNEENVDTIYIKLFEEPQILKFLERMKGEPNKNWKEIEAINGLKDLAKRPVLLNLIVKHLMKILKETKQEVKSIDVFSAAIDDELKEIRKKFRKDDRDYGTDDATRMRILQKVCISLFIKNQLSIPIIEIADYAKNDPDLKNKNAAQIENYLTNFHTYTFFARDKDDIFRISHKAFIDYLAAKELYEEITSNKPVNFGKQQINVAIIHFIFEMKPSKTKLKRLFKTAAETTEKTIWQKSNAVNLILKIDNPRYAGNVDFNSSEVNLENSYLYNIDILIELEKLTNLNLAKNQISNISPLQELKTLVSLDLNNNQISDLSPLQDLKNLTIIDLSINRIRNLKPLHGLINLISLDLFMNKITDIKPLINLRNLQSLSLVGNEINNIEILKDFIYLETLFLAGNQINDIKSLRELKTLKCLTLSYNQIIDIKPLIGLKKLTDLNLRNNRLNNIESLRELKNLLFLCLTTNQINDIGHLKDLKNLTTLELAYNQICDIQPLKNMKKLQRLILSMNKINNIDTLKELKNLTELLITGNPLKSSQIEELRKALPKTNIEFY